MRPPPLRIPAGDGEFVAEPPFDEWPGVLEANRARMAEWAFSVAGTPVAEVRALARREAIESALGAAVRMDGGEPPAGPDADAPLVLTGHQPLLQHPGVWAKVMLASALASRVGGIAIECVVDTDGFDRIAFVAPCDAPSAYRCVVELVVASGEGAYFASSPAPSKMQVDEFEAAGTSAVATLAVPEVTERLRVFADLLRAAVDARDAAEAVTSARRAWEKPLGLDYLPLPLTDQVTGRAFALFVADVALRAQEFLTAHNERLSAYRTAHGVRSVARPFPDLARGDEGVELPFWHLDGTSRTRVWARQSDAGVEVRSNGETLAVIDEDSGITTMVGSLAPKAVALTLFNRFLVADLFVHGAGGAAYDAVTDGIAADLWGVEAPAYAAATLTMRLPVVAPESPDALIAELQQRLHTLEHNPDRLIATGDVPAEAARLVAEKAHLVAEIATQGADKKALGQRIREVNVALAAFAEPLAQAAREELSAAEDVRERRGALRDRTYPFFLWDPFEVRELLP